MDFLRKKIETIQKNLFEDDDTRHSNEKIVKAISLPRRADQIEKQRIERAERYSKLIFSMKKQSVSKSEHESASFWIFLSAVENEKILLEMKQTFEKLGLGTPHCSTI